MKIIHILKYMKLDRYEPQRSSTERTWKKKDVLA